MKNKRGRPEAVDELTLHKLEEVFALGGTDKEACIYANISPSTLYNYQNANPNFLERKELLKQQPVLKARRTINDALEGDIQTARWYVERRDKDFHPKSESEVTKVEKIRLDDPELDKIANDLTKLQKENTGSTRV